MAVLRDKFVPITQGQKLLTSILETLFPTEALTFLLNNAPARVNIVGRSPGSKDEGEGTILIIQESHVGPVQRNHFPAASPSGTRDHETSHRMTFYV